MKRSILLCAAFFMFVAMLATQTSASARDRHEGRPNAGEEPETTEEDFSERAAAMLAEQIGVEPEVAFDYLARRDRVGLLYEALQKASPAGFDEMYTEYTPSYKIIVLTTIGDQDAIDAFAAESGFEDLVPYLDVRKVEYTVAELTKAIEDMEKAAPDVEFVAQVNIQDGTVWFSTKTEADAEKLEEAAAHLSVPTERLQVEAAGLVEFYANSFGGLDLNLQSNHAAECTTGFSVQATSGSGQGVATAAHCANALELNSGQDLTFQAEQFSGSQDTQWHLTPNYDDQPWVRTGGTTHAVINARTPRSNQMVNDFVCLSRRNDTVTCGMIESKVFDLGSGFNATFIRVDAGSTTLAAPGDSGGPWWLTIAGTPGSHRAYGTLEGAPTDDLTDAIYMAQNYMGAIGIQVKTG